MFSEDSPIAMDADSLGEELPPRNGRGRGRGFRGRGSRRGRNRSRSLERYFVSSGRVYVENLNFDTSWQSLKDHMKQVGKVKRADVFFDADGNSTGKGVCEYLYAEDVDRAIRELDGSELDGRPLRIVTGGSGGSRGGGRGRGRGPRRGPMRKARGGPGCRVYVGNLPWETSWQDLKDLMRDVGEVLYADIYMDDRGRSKGSGVVEFSNPQDAQKATDTMQDYDYNGRNIAIVEFDDALAEKAIELLNDTMFDGRRIQVREDQ